MVEYREYGGSDFLPLCSLSDDEWRSAHMRIGRSLLKPNQVEACYIAMDEGRLVGYIYGFILPNRTLIVDFLYVLPAYRRRGIASGLLRMLEDTACCDASLVFYNKSLHGFYAGHGYQTGDNLEAAVKEIQP